jgi:RNA polymerase subunit RPABC4/transcription elongation factor Spt4
VETISLISERGQYYENVIARELQAAQDCIDTQFGASTCPWCGSTFGMVRLYLEMLVITPPRPGERFFRCDDDKPGDPWVWQICPECNGRGVVENGFHELSHEDVDALVASYTGVEWYNEQA